MLPSGSATQSAPLKRKHLGPEETRTTAHAQPLAGVSTGAPVPGQRIVNLSDFRNMLDTATQAIFKPEKDSRDALKKLGKAICDFPAFFQASPQWHDKALAKKLLAYSGGFLRYVHPTFRDDPVLVDLALKKTPWAYRYASHRFMYNIVNVLKYKNVSVLPTIVNGIERLSKPELLNALAHLPCEIACRVFSSAVEQARQSSAQFSDLNIELQSLRDGANKSLSNVPHAEKLRIMSALIPHASAIDPLELENLAQVFYPDHRSLLICRSPKPYVSTISAWLKANNVTVYEASVLFDPDRVGELFTNTNAVIFLNRQDMLNHGSGFNGLLESGSWQVQGISGKVVAKIVLVLEDKKILSKDIVNRLAAHVDACLLLANYLEAPHSGAAIHSTDHSPHDLLTHHSGLPDEEKDKWQLEHVSELFDRKTLLSKRFITPEQLFQEFSPDQEGIPNVLVHDADEAWSIKELLPTETSYSVPAPIAFSDMETGSVERIFSGTVTQESSLFLVEGASDVNDLIDHYFRKCSHQSQDSLANQLAKTHVNINSMAANNLYASVFESNNGPHLIYRKRSFPVASLHRSDFSPLPKDVRSKPFKRLDSQQMIAYIKGNYQSGKYCTHNQAGEVLFEAISKFMVSDESVLLIEGSSGIGKDALSSQLLEEFQSSFSDELKYHHVTAAYDISLIDEMISLRKNFPDHTLMVHISEANLNSKKMWSNILLFMKTDGNIKVLASQNPASFGGRFVFPADWSKVTVPNYSPREMVLIAEYMLRELGLKGVFTRELDSNLAKIVLVHCYFQENTKTGVTLRQMHHFLDLLIKDPEDVSPNTIHSKLYRAYGSSLDDAVDKFRVNDISHALAPFKTHSSRNKISKSLAMKNTDPSLYNYSNAPAAILPWQGNNTGYLSDQVLEYELSPLNSELKPYEVTVSSDHAIEPGGVIGLLSFPGQKVAVIPRNASNFKHRAGAIGVERQFGRLVIRNRKHFPIKIDLKFKDEPLRFSRINPKRLVGLKQTPQQFTEQQRQLLSTLCRYVNKAPVTTHAEQQSVLANYFGISQRHDGTYDPAEVVTKLFRFFCRFADGPYTVKPRDEDLDHPSTQLFHSLLSERGVCRHQCAWLVTLLKCFDLSATQHANERHSFAVLENGVALDVDYFKNPTIKEHYHLLEKNVDELRNSNHQSLEKEKALKEAKNLLRSNQVSHIQLSDLIKLNTALRPIEKNNESAKVHTVASQLKVSHPQLNQKDRPKRPTENKPALRTTPESLMNDLREGIIIADDIPKILQTPGAASVQQWINACSFSDAQKDEPTAEGPPPAKRIKTESPIKDDGAHQKDALKSIFMSLIARVPSGTMMIRKFLPASQFKQNQLPLRAKPIPGGWLVRYEKPAVDYTIRVCLQPPVVFKEPYWLLQSQGQAVKVDSQDKHRSLDRSTLYVVSSKDSQIFDEVLHNLTQQK